MTDSETTIHHLLCSSCGASLQLDGVQFKVARATQPEGFYCDGCSARLAAAPSFADWLETEWQRQQEQNQ